MTIRRNEVNKAQCIKCGKAIEFRAVDPKGQESYWFHMDTTNRGQKRHVARPAKVA
jgi:hypothetical protein